jgi:hypothetical protein
MKSLSNRSLVFSLLCGLLLASSIGFSSAQDQKPNKKQQKEQEKALAGPRATVLRITILYVAPDKDSQKVERVQPGREMVVAETNGPWVRVYANTDNQPQHNDDEPIFGDPPPPPVSGWMEAKGIVRDTTPNGDAILMGEAANEEAEASNPRGPANAAMSARLLYRRVVEMFHKSPFVAEAMWRAADVRWQIEKADASSRGSAHEKEAYLRQELSEEEMKKVIKYYPHTKQADLAAFALIDNKTCGDWQGDVKCPEKESELYEKYAAEHPDGVKTAQALYMAVYRQASLKDMYASEGNDKRADDAHKHATELAARLKDKFPQSDYSVRAGALVYKLDEGVPVYGIDLQ